MATSTFRTANTHSARFITRRFLRRIGDAVNEVYRDLASGRFEAA